MRFATVTAITFFTTIASASNLFLKPGAGEKVPAGKDYLIMWVADTPGPMVLTLMEGDPGNLEDAGTIVLLEHNFGNYTWAVPADQQPDKDYSLQIQWGDTPPLDENYSEQFEIVAGKPGESTTTTEQIVTETVTSGPHNDSGYGTTTVTVTDSDPHESSGASITPGPTKTQGPKPPTPTHGSGPFGAPKSVAAVVAVPAATVLTYFPAVIALIIQFTVIGEY